MAYNEFAYFYDELNGEADYDALFGYVAGQLQEHGVRDGIVVDLGCGTGDLTLMLAQCGYDMIGVDQSAEMLSVLREKAAELGVSDGLLLLQQDILDLDLYGTIRAAVSTFDTFNHIGPRERFEKAIEKAAFFMEKDGVFVFDLNTPYKHSQILAGQSFTIECPDAVCCWSNQYDPQAGRLDIDVSIRYSDPPEECREQFSEYTYEQAYVTEVLERYGFTVACVRDGETFGLLRPDSQRYIFTAIKQYTQQGENQQ